METCVRGFSFMPENKVEVVELKYVESEDLERTWKAARRERLKHQEQKIWEEFVKDQDIVRSLCQDDPYQFVNHLPQECIKELLDMELQKMKQEKLEEIGQNEQPQVEEEPPNNQHVVTFVEDSEEDMMNIFEEDRDDDVSGPEDEMLNDSISPPLTVRERDAPSPDKTSSEGMRVMDHLNKQLNAKSKSSNENVTDVIEGSIYCAKVKDLRLKIVDELNNIICSLSVVHVLDVDPSALPAAMRRSKEFSARYQRVHLYQLQRQISDIERNNNRALPFAARTHYQAQLSRVASLHNNLLHALQVYHKSLPQTLCIFESAELLRSVSSVTRQATAASQAARPVGLPAADTLYNDAVVETSDKLLETLDQYTAKMTDCINSTENTSASVSRKSKVTSKKSAGTWSRSGKSLLSATDARLSMYSLDTRLTLNRSTSSKEYSSGTSKRQGSILIKSKQPVDKEDVQSKGPKKSPSGRRPLMRAPRSQPRPRAPRDHDLRTLVETVACASSHISREVSPMISPKSKNTTPRRNSRETTPRKTNRRSLNNTPRNICTGNKHVKKDGARSRSEPNENDSPRSVDIETCRRNTAEETENTRIVGGREKSAVTVRVEGSEDDKSRREKDNIKIPDHQMSPANLEVTRLLRQLCGGDVAGSRSERVSGSRNAQLLCVAGGSVRQPSTPQLLRILEETIQKKAPKPLFPKPLSARDKDRYRMTFNIPDHTLDNMFQYRTKFVQHMLTSPMYANSSVGKPWEKIGRVSEQIIDELLLSCVKQMELQDFIKDLYKTETSS